MEHAKGKLEEVVFETPDPPAASNQSPPTRSASNYLNEDLDTSSAPTQAAFQKFRQEEEAASGKSQKARSGYEVGKKGAFGLQVGKKGAFELPEQRLMRLQVARRSSLHSTPWILSSCIASKVRHLPL